MQIAQSRKQVRISKARALEQDRSNTKGAELLPNTPSYWKEWVLHTCHGPSAPDSWWAHTAFAKAGGEGVQGLPHPLLKLLNSGRQSPGLSIFSSPAASIQPLFKAHLQERTLTFPWQEREYGSPPHSGEKEKFSSLEDCPEIQQGKGSQWWVKLVCWREGSRWKLYPSPWHYTALFVPV